MAVRGMNLDWRTYDVKCSECGVGLKRKLFHPTTGAAISAFFCNRACKGAWQRRNKPVDEAWLRQKYCIEGLDCVQISALVSRHPKSVWNWLKGYGIETRARGGNAGANFHSGQINGMEGKHHSAETREKIRAARLADGHFPKDGGRPYWEGKKGTIHPSWRGGATPERQAFYATKEWAEARRVTYARAKTSCERCGENHAAATLHIHHVMPFLFEKRRADPANLRLLCAPCHRWVHSSHNIDREFLPPFGVYPFTKNGTTKLVRISYFPKHKARLPCWM